MSSAKFGLTILVITSDQKETDAGMPFFQTFLDTVENVDQKFKRKIWFLLKLLVKQRRTDRFVLWVRGQTCINVDSTNSTRVKVLFKLHKLHKFFNCFYFSFLSCLHLSCRVRISDAWQLEMPWHSGEVGRILWKTPLLNSTCFLLESLSSVANFIQICRPRRIGSKPSN